MSEARTCVAEVWQSETRYEEQINLPIQRDINLSL